jgi:P pilus assembly chaperone PapD
MKKTFHNQTRRDYCYEKIHLLLTLSAMSLALMAGQSHATGMIPETSVVIVEAADGEGAINVKNSDSFPVLLMTTLENIPDDNESLLLVTPPAARVEAGKSQRVRFILTSKTPLKTERLKRVIFEGVPPKEKGKNEVTHDSATKSARLITALLVRLKMMHHGKS